MVIPEIALREQMAAEHRPDHNWEAELANTLRSHGPREGKALAAYKRLADKSDSDGLRYLANLIIEDEQRHHKVITEMLNRVESDRSEVELEPNVPGSITADRTFLQETRAILDFEKRDRRDLRQLKKAMRHEPASSLLPLLVDMMLHDTGKHIDILKFILDHATVR